MAGKINLTNSTVGSMKDNVCSDGIYIDGVRVDALRNLPKTLIDENGGSFGYVCIWRSPKDDDDYARKCSVGEFLSKKENQSGTWYIDGGWGGPPGPIRVDWDEQNQCWINKGFPPHK